jgi:transcriptional regulator with XRE-family HTH domain
MGSVACWDFTATSTLELTAPVLPSRRSVAEYDLGCCPARTVTVDKARSTRLPIVEDIRIGRIGRALRHRQRLRQVDLGRRVGVSQGEVSLFERGRISGMPIRTIRRILAGVDAELVLTVRWRGGDLDRVLDEAHARLGERVVGMLQGDGWVAIPEVSFSVFGDRGSIDILGWHPATQSLLVIELKSEIASIEETLRRHDVKLRLARRIALERFDWDAVSVARLLVLPEHRTIRRQVEDKAKLFQSVYPARNVAVRHWLSSPAGPLSGILFVSPTSSARGAPGQPVRKRVRVGVPLTDRRSCRHRPSSFPPTTSDSAV